MWKFIMGFLPKCGSIAYNDVKESFRVATLKTGAIGVKVKILPPNVRMPDEVIIIEQVTESVTDLKEPIKTEEGLIEAMEKSEAKESKPKPKDKKEQIAELAKKLEAKASEKQKDSLKELMEKKDDEE